jgi:hypothetical protein
MGLGTRSNQQNMVGTIPFQFQASLEEDWQIFFPPSWMFATMEAN